MHSSWALVGVSVIMVVVVFVRPEHQHLGAMGDHVHRLPHGQKHLGRHVPKGQTSDHFRLGICAQPRNHLLHAKALVLGRRLEAIECAKKNHFLLRQNTGMQQLRQHALYAVRWLGNVF